MRIYGPNGTTIGTTGANAKRTSSTGFSLQPDAAATPESRSVGAPPVAAKSVQFLAGDVVGGPPRNVWIVVARQLPTTAVELGDSQLRSNR